MNFQEQMDQLRREYRTEASRLDNRLEELSERTDVGFTRLLTHLTGVRNETKGVQGQMQQVQGQMQQVEGRMQQVQEQMQQVQEQMQRTQEQMQRTQEQMQRVQEPMQRMQDRMVAMDDQMGGAVGSIQQLQVDQKEGARTLQGRARLLEERFGKMLDLVESTVVETPTRNDYESLAERVEALEKKLNSAA